jgi:hypothetical protein
MTGAWEEARMSRLFIVPLLGALLVALAAPVGAQEQFRFSITTNGIQADAFWQSCTPDTPEEGLQTCTFANVFVVEGTQRSQEGTGKPAKQGSMACLGIAQAIVTDTFEFVEEISNEFGCTALAGDTFIVADDLSSATLNATIAIDAFVCDEFGCEPAGDPRNVAVAVTWTAITDLVTFRERSVSHSTQDGQMCTFMFSGSGERRLATAMGTVDGTPLGDSQFAQITEGRVSSSNRCR